MDLTLHKLPRRRVASDAITVDTLMYWLGHLWYTMPSF
jgi:hypothetical protein